MKSPITAKEMKLTKEIRSMEFRKETFEVVFHYYRCEDSGEQFTNTELDELNINQVYNQYRDLFNIPFPDEIIRIREKYELSASKMSEILGLGTNGYRQYEAGEMPSISNAKLIQLAQNPVNFKEMVSLCDTLENKIKVKYIQRAEHLIEEHKRNIFNFNIKDYLLGNHLADVYSGYRNPSFEKFTEMVVFFAERLKPFKTKMNKLLFYADFMMFKQSCFSISGVRYKAIDMGPVPNNFNSVFEYLANNNDIDIYHIQFQQGHEGEQFKARKDRPFDETKFSKEELKTLELIATKFKDVSTNDIIQLSHLEEAWKQNHKEKKEISYKYAFDLIQL
ncbi:MAG: type II toxin-antitoxin system antitoxin SocA domain-containing protein [Bacteroidia bacterium]